MLGYTVTQWLFGILSFLAIMFALMVVFSRNPVNSVLYLVLTFFCIAGHYLLLNAQFLAVVHIVVYAGAIMVLFLFVIMLLNLNAETEPHKSGKLKFAAVISAGMLFITLIAALKTTQLGGFEPPPASLNGMVEHVGQRLFTDYLLPFEISSILFLSAMIGAVA